MEALIFNLQSFSLHDGPGIRTTVFFKGCPLKCLWCHNPESHKRMPELFFYSEKCVGCKACMSACPHRAVQVVHGKAVTNKVLCQGCGKCIESCPVQAREISGKCMNLEEVMSAIRSDKMFYDTSGGGVTFSGGEPLLWPDMVMALAEQCYEEGIHTAIETSGYNPNVFLPKVLKNIDLVLFDLKAMDPKLHQKLTGVSNEPILENVRQICHDMKKDLVIRIPVIPGCNDREENIRRSAKFVAGELRPDIPIHLLPYHDFGCAKAERMEQEDIPCFAVPTSEHMERIKGWMEEYGLKVQIGGSM